MKEGSTDDVAPGTIALVETTDTPALGAPVTVKNAAGTSEQLKVVAILKTSLDSSVTGSYVDEQTFDGLVGDTAPTVAFLNTEPNAQSETNDAIEALAAERPDISAQEGNFVGRLISQIFDFIINAVNGLLVMSIIIALIGMINTLSLSIYERRRELGLLRASRHDRQAGAAHGAPGSGPHLCARHRHRRRARAVHGLVADPRDQPAQRRERRGQPPVRETRPRARAGRRARRARLADPGSPLDEVDVLDAIQST